MKLDYGKMAREIIEKVGGKENISSMTHCATRLRLIVKNRDIIDDGKVTDIEGVKGVFYNAGQYQIILGTGVVNRVYDECCAMDISVSTKEEIKEVKEGNKNKLQKAVRTLGDVFVPIIPVIVATGLILGLKGALLNDNFLGLFGASSADIPQNVLVLLDVLSGTTFSFMPALVCWSAFKTFGGNPVLGIVLGLMLVSTSLPNAYSVADPSSGITPLYLFNFIPIVGYQGSVLPAFAVGLIGAKFEKFLHKKVPATFDLLITPFVVLVVMMCLALIVIGPILHVVEQFVLNVLTMFMGLPFGIGGFLIGFFWSIIVLTGIHHLSNILEISILTQTGFNPVNAIYTFGGFANAACCLALTLKSKDRPTKLLGKSATVSSLLGIGEPALFGVILKNSIRPFMIMCLCSGFAGMASSLLGLQGTGNGISTIPGLLLFVYSPYQLLCYIGVAIFTFAITFAATWFFAKAE